MTAPEEKRMESAESASTICVLATKMEEKISKTVTTDTYFITGISP
jgi:hypothetical protein